MDSLGLFVKVIDLVALVSGIMAAYLWFRASRRQLRRVSHHETIDAADFNRIITSVNRSQLLNSRAALATGVSMLAVAARMGLDLLI